MWETEDKECAARNDRTDKIAILKAWIKNNPDSPQLGVWEGQIKILEEEE